MSLTNLLMSLEENYLIEEKDIPKKHQLITIKFILEQENIWMGQ